MTFDDVRAIACAWPGVEDGMSYGTPALKAKGKLLTRLREDGDSLVVKGVVPDERDMLIAANPAVFFVTDHYRDWPIVLVRLSQAQAADVEGLMRRHWSSLVPKRQRGA